jgi:hypothetical protein
MEDFLASHVYRRLSLVVNSQISHTYHIISSIISYHISYIISFHIIAYHIISHISYHIISYHLSYIISYHFISYHIYSYHIISYPIYTHIISFPIIYTHIISYHFISYHTWLTIYYGFYGLWLLLGMHIPFKFNKLCDCQFRFFYGVCPFYWK